MKGKVGKKLFAGFLATLTAFSVLPELALQGAKAQSKESVPESATIGEVLYENDFTSATLSNWTTSEVGSGWLWNPDAGTAVVDEMQDGVRLQAVAGTQAVALPAIGASDYVYSATIKVLGSGGSFGLLTDIKNPVSESVGAMHYGLYVGDTTNYGLYQYTRVGETYHNTVYNNPVQLLGNSVSQGDTCTLTVYNIVGKTYFYIDGELIATGDAHFFGTENYDIVGLYACDTDILVTSVRVNALKGVTDALRIDGATVRYADEDGYTSGEKSFGLRFSAFIDKTSDVYKKAVQDGTYDTSLYSVKFGVVLLPTDLIPENEWLNKDTPMAIDVPMDKIATQTENGIRYYVSLLNIPQEDYDREYSARAYMKVKKGDAWEYTYAGNTFSCDLVQVGSTYYNDVDEKVQARLDEMFENTKGYYGKNANSITFSLFADFHYRNGFYMSSIKDMEAIMDKAHANDVDFVLQLGDFCDDYVGSPEITKAYKENKYDLPVYGVYGNHELQGAGATMAYVTPAMTNRADTIVWGTADGKIGDGSIAYYYFDVNGIRVICTDTNYGWHKERQTWVHRESLTFAQTYGDGAVTQENALGAKQRSWLKNVLDDAVDRKMSCIVLSHHALSGVLSQPPADAEQVREIFNNANAKRAGTVLAVLNGHLHSDNFVMQDNILYFDVNTVRNGTFIDEKNVTYGELTFEREFYDDDGNFIKTETVKVDSINGADQTNFYADPLSTIVTISDSGRIVVEGMKTDWFGGVLPPENRRHKHTWISAGTFDVPVSYD